MMRAAERALVTSEHDISCSVATRRRHDARRAADPRVMVVYETRLTVNGLCGARP